MLFELINVFRLRAWHLAVYEGSLVRFAMIKANELSQPRFFPELGCLFFALSPRGYSVYRIRTLIFASCL